MSRSDRRFWKHRHFAALAVGFAAFSGPASAAEVVLVTAINSRISILSTDEASQLYLGRRTTLEDGTQVSLYDLPIGPTRDRLYTLLTGKNPSQIRAYWSRQVFTGRALPPREASSQADLPTLLLNDPTAIGYLPDGPLDPRLRVLLKLP